MVDVVVVRWEMEGGDNGGAEIILIEVRPYGGEEVGVREELIRMECLGSGR